jgi:hypothetical protein
MNSRTELVFIERTIERADLISAFSALRSKGVLEMRTDQGVKLKVPVSEAFSISILPTTDALESIALQIVMVRLLSEKGFTAGLRDLVKAIYQSLQSGRIGAESSPLNNLPEIKFEPDLNEKVLRWLVALEKEGRI